MAERFRYDVAGLIIDSSFVIPEARPANLHATDCVVDLAPLETPLASDPGDSWIHIERHGSTMSLRFAEMALFELSAHGDRVVCRSATGVPDETIRHFLLDHVIPRILVQRGLVVLHASAVATTHGAVGFCGITGVGKSTLAGSFALTGASLLADDAFVIEETSRGPEARPTYPGFRLWPDNVQAVVGSEAAGGPVAHYTKKRRIGPTDVSPEAFALARCPVARVFMLETGPEISIQPIGERDAFLALSKHAFRLDINDMKSVASSFDVLSRSGLLRLCSTLRYPRVHERLPEVRAAIQKEIAGFQA